MADPQPARPGRTVDQASGVPRQPLDEAAARTPEHPLQRAAPLAHTPCSPRDPAAAEPGDRVSDYAPPDGYLAGAASRAHVRHVLLRWGAPQYVEDAEALADDLVTGAGAQTGGAVRLSLALHGDRLTVAVREEAGAGRGLLAVARTAAARGREVHGTPRCVWAHLPAGPPPQRTAPRRAHCAH